MTEDEAMEHVKNASNIKSYTLNSQEENFLRVLYRKLSKNKKCKLVIFCDCMSAYDAISLTSMLLEHMNRVPVLLIPENKSYILSSPDEIHPNIIENNKEMITGFSNENVLINSDFKNLYEYDNFDFSIDFIAEFPDVTNFSILGYFKKYTDKGYVII